MSTLSRLALALAFLVLGLGACSDPEPEVTGPAIEVSGTVGRAPVVVFPAPLPLADLSVEQVVAGEGRILESGDPALISVTAYDGATGGFYEDREPAELRTIVLEEDSVGSELYDAIEGEREGSRMLLSQPVESGDAEQMVVLVIDILPTRADGEPIEETEGLPVVILGEDGEPSIELPAHDPPTQSAVSVLQRGVGEQVRPGQDVTVQYTAVVWPGGEVYESTWNEGRLPRTLSLEGTFVGLRDALIDQTVGSQVLIVVPPELGTGEETLVIVVDVLAASGGPDSTVSPATPTEDSAARTTDGTGEDGEDDEGE